MFEYNPTYPWPSRNIVYPSNIYGTRWEIRVRNFHPYERDDKILFIAGQAGIHESYCHIVRSKDHVTLYLLVMMNVRGYTSVERLASYKSMHRVLYVDFINTK